MAKVQVGSTLVLLVGFCLPAAADPGERDLPFASFPASSAARLVYGLVPCPLGVRTWAEEQVLAIRLGGQESREDVGPQATFVLLSLHARDDGAYALEMAEAPKDVPVGNKSAADPESVLSGDRNETAFAAMGVSPEELMQAPDTPQAAYTVMDTIEGLYETGLHYGGKIRAQIWGAPRERGRVVDVGPQRESAPAYVRYQKPAPNDGPQDPTMRFTKRVARSGYKVALGIAIGVLIWSYVRTGK